MADVDTVQVLGRMQEVDNLHVLRARDDTFNAHSESPNKRVSDSSIASDPFENATPASLDADLTHYKDLFTKLKFSYLEQVTKEKFLRSITASPPVFIDGAQIAELERQIADDKAALKVQKGETQKLVTELEQAGADLARRYEALTAHKTELEGLPQQLAALQAEIGDLQELEAQEESRNERSQDPQMQLNLTDTIELVEEKEAQYNALDEELETLRALLPSKSAEVERLEREIRPLEVQKMGAVAAAREARDRKEGRGDNLDELEAQGRWSSAATRSLSQWLEVET